MEVLITAVVGLITTIVSGWTSWFFTKKKYNAEVDSNLIENMQKSLEFYMKLSDDNKSRLDEALKRNDILEDEIRELRKQVSELTLSICLDMSCELRKRKFKSRITEEDETDSGEEVQGA